jgi:hypothetical protein
MASPLNNPMVVAGLVVGGACLLLYQFVPADWLERLEGKPVRAAAPPPMKVIDPESLGPERRYFLARPTGMPAKNSSAIMQKTEFKRDIFYESPKLGIDKEPTPLPKEWKLTGIYLDEKSQPPVRAAVVSGDILRPGNKKGEFLVEEITAESVTFSHPTGKQTLSFSKSTKAQKK